MTTGGSARPETGAPTRSARSASVRAGVCGRDVGPLPEGRGADPLFAGFLRGYMHDEAIPTLQPVPGIDLGEYVESLLARFGSEAVGDTLARQVVDGSAVRIALGRRGARV